MTTPIFRFSYNKRPQLAQRYVFFGVMPIGIAAVPTFVLARYLFLEDHYIGQNYIQAGLTASNADLLPNNWIPTPNVDPLNPAAVQAFYNAGPQDQGLIRTQWIDRFVPIPVTHWVEVAPNFWALTGLGSNRTTFPPKFAVLAHPVQR